MIPGFQEDVVLGVFISFENIFSIRYRTLPEDGDVMIGICLFSDISTIILHCGNKCGRIIRTKMLLFNCYCSYFISRKCDFRVRW